MFYTVLRWAFAVGMGLASLGLIGQGSIFNALIAAIGALLISPPGG